jgi:membrane fusion protein (multidrug efflux system)
MTAACSRDQPPQAAPPPPPRVLAMKVIQRDAEIVDERVGEVRAFREVALRPQVTGWLQNIHFEPGQRVRRNDRLFVIDPRPYQAALHEALAAVADAQAALARAEQDVARYEPLLPDNAIPRATYDAAVAAAKSARAALKQRQASAQRARLEVANSIVRSPVTGQIGAQQVEVGALVRAGETVLATVSTLDPVYVTFSISETDYVRFVRGAGSREAARKRALANPLRLVLPDGTLYPETGKFDFAERAFSEATGTLDLRARFPNTEYLLRPGMNVRVRMVYERIEDALLVPQRAVTEVLNRQFVTVLNKDNKAEQRAVTLGDAVGQLRVVREGIQAGEVVVVEGTQKATAGTTVTPVLVTEAQLEQPPAAAANAGAQTSMR